MPSFTSFTKIILPLLMVCSLAMSACTVAPVCNRDEITETLPENFSSSNRQVEEKALAWEESFPSAALAADIKILMQENFELQAARARVDQAAAAFGIVRADRLPYLEAQANVDRTREKEDEPDGTTTTRNTIAFSATLSWELDIWGRLKARQASAELTLQEKQALVDRIALDLETLLVESWIAHHGARRLKRVLDEQQGTNRQYLTLTELRLAQGQGSALDVLQQRGRLVTTAGNLPGVDDKRQRSANAYAVLMGRLPDGRDLPEDAWPVIEPLKFLPSPRRLLEDRPDLRASFLALEAADHQVAAAIADRLPRLSISATVEQSGRNLAHLGDGSIYQVASGLLVPIFDAGRLKAKAAQRKAEALESLAILEQTMRVAVREVEDALTREKSLFEERRLLQSEIAIARDTVKKATLCYVNGQETFLAVLTALAKQQALQQKEITLEQDLLINRGNLLKALGAKWILI